MRRLAPILLVLVGVVVAGGSAAWTVVSWNTQMAAGHPISVPSVLEVDLGPDAPEHALWREMEGTHVTMNRPLLDAPADLGVAISDRRTGDSIATSDFSGYRTRQNLMPGFVRHRRGVVRFDPPAHGEILVEVSGTFAYEQPYRVSPSMSAWIARFEAYGWIGVVVGAVLALGGVGMLVARALRAEARIALAR